MKPFFKTLQGHAVLIAAAFLLALIGREYVRAQALNNTSAQPMESFPALTGTALPPALPAVPVGVHVFYIYTPETSSTYGYESGGVLYTGTTYTSGTGLSEVYYKGIASSTTNGWVLISGTGPIAQ